MPSLLGALSFAFAGAMSAQVAHFGLVAGMSWVPVQLLCVLRLSQPRTMPSRLAWTGLLAGAFGLTILAGEPRAIDDAGLIVLLYAAWQIARLGRRFGPAACSVASGLALGACLGAVQWLPGLAVVGSSQRGISSAALFNSGSLPHRWLLLMLVPDLLGGSGSFGQPAFLANYNLAEVTGYVGILPLVAATALLGRVRLRPRPPEWLVWHVMALAGIVLALGGNTPVGSLLVHLPLFDSQRLQSRNILIADLALAVLLAYWADQPLRAGSRRFLRAPRSPRARSGDGTGPAAPARRARRRHPRPVLGRGPAALAAGQPGRHQPRRPAQAGARPVPADRRGGRSRSWSSAGTSGRWPARGGWPASCWPTWSYSRFSAWSRSFPAWAAATGTAAAATRTAGRAAGARTRAPDPPAEPIADLGYPGRFAIYDPDQLNGQDLSLLGAPDLNVITRTPSVQGYSSLVSGFYASATGSHRATGDGQDVLDPRAVRTGVLDQLDTSVLLTVPAYLTTRSGTAAARRPRRLPGHRAPAIATSPRATRPPGISRSPSA